MIHSQNKVSNGSGNWSNAAIWTPAGVPTSTNNVTISNGNTITFDVSGSCSSLTVGTGGTAATLRFSGNTALTLSVGSNITINANGNLIVRPNSNTTHTLTLGGNLVNSGTLRLLRDANSLCNVIFNRNGNQTVSGTGVLNAFNRIILNMGASVNNVLEVSCSPFTVASNFLTLTNGVFRLSTPNAATVVPFTALTTINSNSGIWLSSSTAVMSASAGINLSGLMRVSLGTLTVGNAADEDLSAAGGTLNVAGGILNVAGKYNASSTATSFSLTGGTINVANIGSTNTTIAPFQISAAGSSFNVSGGTIVIPREGGSGAQDLGFVNTGSTAGSVTGGTIQIGNTTTPVSQTISLNSSFTVPNLLINSANATARLLTNSLSVFGNITITTGTLNANNLGMALSGSWSDAGTFVSGTGTVNFNGTSAQSIFRLGGETFNHLLFNGAGTKTFSSSILANGNFSINTNSPVDVSASNFSLTVRGNFINSGSFNARNGTVLLSGITSQSIGGSSATTFFNLTLNNTAGAILNSAENIEGTLSLNNGTFNTNSQAFTLISNASTTGRIGQITGTGDITGNVIVQRYAPGGSTGWALFGTPISSALSLNDWDDDIVISCPTCPDGNVPNFLSVYTYDETQAGASDAAASYVGLNSINDAIVANKGYWVYLGNGAVTTTSIVIDVTGAVRKFNQSIPLNYTNFGSAIDDGWNLIHNPYPSAISWAALRASSTNIDDAIYVYNADLNSGAGAFATYVNGISSPAEGSGGIGDNIPMCQGFYVHSTGSTLLTAQESNKVSGNPTFLKSAAAANTASLLRLNLRGTNSYLDEAVVYFQNGATKNFEYDYDAYKMASFDPLAPAISINYGGLNFQINGVPPLNGSFTIPVRVTTGVSGTFTISANEINSFPLGTCIVLFDKVTSTTTDLKSSNYVFYLADTTVAPRFELQITLNTLNISSQVNQPTCQLYDKGCISAKGLNQGPWNYVWKNNGTIIKTSNNMVFADTLKNLTGGVFDLEISTVGLCDNSTSQFSILSKVPVTAQFSSIDTLVLSQSSGVQFINTSINSTSQLWHSEFNNSTSNAHSPVFNYSEPGEFEVKLISSNTSGCIDSTQKKIIVVDGSTSLKENQETFSFFIKTLESNRYALQGSFKENQKTEIHLFDATGRLIKKYDSIVSTDPSLTIDLNGYPQGVYLLNISSGTKETRTFKLLVN